jgi:hypothetical protein
MSDYECEPSSVPLSTALRAAEFRSFVLSLGFYGICGAIALLPRGLRSRSLTAFVSWSEKVDESRYR